MARFTFSINGILDLEPVSFDKVDKFYTMQNEFLRDTAVLTSTSRYSEMLHLATFAFDVSKNEDVDKLTRLVGMCRAFPYIFIKSDAIYDKHLDPMSLMIGSGYYMYAIHEYEVEMNSSDSGQGVAMFSMRLQMVNWRPLTRQIKFISINGEDQEKPGPIGVHKDIKFKSDIAAPEAGGAVVTYVENPEDSNLLHRIIDFYHAKSSKFSDGLLNSGMNRTFEFNLGYPVIVETQEELNSLKEEFVWGTYKTFRVLKTVSTSNTGNLNFDGSRETKAKSMSEIPEDQPNRWDEESRIYVGWVRERVAGTAVKDGGVALQSIIVRKRNRFANQTIQGFKYPYAQFLGSSPTELLVSTVVNHEQGMSSGSVMAANSKITSIQNANDMASRADVAFPSLKGLNVLAVENPLANALGLEFVVLDSSHASTAGTANNILIHNHTFIESNSQEMVDRSKYARANKVDEWNDSVNKGSRLLYIINKDIENKKTGATDKALSRLSEKAANMIVNAVNLLIEQDKSSAKERKMDGTLVKKDSFIAEMVNTKEWKSKDIYEKAQWAIGWYIHYDNQPSANKVEERLKDERLRKLRSAVEYAYREIYTGGLSHGMVIRGLHEDIKTQKKWIEDNNGFKTTMDGEGLPDMHYKEVYETIPETREYPTWKQLPVLPFIYDVGIYDGRKVLAMWEQMKPHIDEMFKNQSELLEGHLSTTFTSVVNYNGTTATTGAESITQEPDGSVIDGKEGAKQDKGKAEIEVKEDVNAKLSNMPGGWLPLLSVGASGKLGSRFGMRHHPVDKVWKMHNGVDIKMPQGTTLYAAASGKVTRATYNGTGYGGVVYINHGNGVETRYAHMNVISVQAGQSVQKGQVIGKSGGAKGTRGAGKSTGPHLHYETRVNGNPVDPVKFHSSPGRASSQAPTKANINKEVKQATTAKMAEAKAAVGTGQSNVSLKDFIVVGESRGNYNIHNINGRKGKGLGGAATANITNMTLDEVRARNGKGLGQWWAVGKYQTIPGTLDEAARGLKLSGSTKLTPEVQERIGTYLIFQKRPALGAYIRGESNDIEAAHKAMAMEWASVPMPNGRSYYSKDKVHRGHTPAMVKAALRGARAAYAKAISEGKSRAEAENIAAGSASTAAMANAASSDATPEEMTNDALRGLHDKIAMQRTKDAIDMPVNPIPWIEEIQATSRIENMVKDFHYGIEKLMPTYKVYIVHGNDENSLLHLIDFRINANYYEIPSVRNLRIEMANQDNPIAVASFEVMNPLNTSSDPKEMRGNRNTAADLTALGSEEAQIIVLDMLRLKAGNKIQIRMGYSNDPNELPIIFNGMITESDTGEILHIVAEGYGRELQNEIIFAGDVIGSTMFMSDNDNKYISAAVARIVKSAELQHFGRNSKWFKSADSSSSGDIHMESLASQTVGDSGFNADAPIWNSHIDSYFKYDTKGPTDALENFWLMNVDQADRFFNQQWHDIFPGGLRDMFPDFHIMNKTTWDVISTGRRLFPSSISLIKNMDGRCTIFTGIKEQMMLGTQRQHTLAGDLLRSIEKAKKPDLDKGAIGTLRSVNGLGPGGQLANSIQEWQVNRNHEKAMKERVDQMAKAKEESMEIMQEALDSKYTSDDNWVPATNFHIISDSHNLISNQLKLNQNCITSVSVPYADDPKDFNEDGSMKMFDMKANGGLFPAFTKEIYHKDSSLSSLGMAIKTAQGVLLEELERMYDGVIIINGNPLVAPGDYAYIHDDMRHMSGVIKCREVQHVFTEYDGYITIITPGMFVEPATHLYSSLYLKFGVFASYVTSAISEYRQYTSSLSSFGNIYNPENIMLTNKDSESQMVKLAGLNVATTGLIARGMYLGAKAMARGGLKIGSWTSKMATRMGSSWFSHIFQKASMFGSSIGPRFAATVARLKPIYDGIKFATLAARFGGGFAGFGMAAGVWAAIIAIVVVAVWGFTKSLYEAWKTKIEYRHRALLKMPIKVYGQEYTAGLFGWNDELTVLELQVENIKRSYSNAMDIYKAATVADASGGDKFRLLHRILTD